MAEEDGEIPDDTNTEPSKKSAVVVCCQATADFVRTKTLELIGLRLSPVQHVYWKAVQRRIVLGQLQKLVESAGSPDGDAKELPPIPWELLRALTKSDKAMCSGVSEVCLGMEVANRREQDPHRSTEGRTTTRGFSPSDFIPMRQLQPSGSLLEEPETVDYGEDFPDTGPVPRLRRVGQYTAAQTGRLPRGLVSDSLEELDQHGSFCNRVIVFLKFIMSKVLKDKRVHHKQGYEEMILSDGDSVSREDETDGVEDSDAGKIDVSELSFFDRDDDEEALTWKMKKMNIPPSRRGRILRHLPVGREEQDKTRSFNVKRHDSIDTRKIRKEKRKERRKKRKEEWERRRKEWRPIWQKINNFIPLRVTNFKYKYTSVNHQVRIKEMRDKAARWPLFTWWISFVQIVVTILSLSIYGVAPVGYGEFSERSLVQLSDLSVQVVERNVSPNFWVGPTQENLVLLGANYGPCMRKDRRLLEGIEHDTFEEALSGCCVRRDQSGCVQTAKSDCPVAQQFADFVANDSAVDPQGPYSTGAVCGTSPLTCTDPDPARDPRWESENVTGWPICTEMEPVVGNGSEHLTCTLTGRPCCVGIQAICLITSQEHCDYIRGTFYPEAFLCSQVDCLGAVCGLLPFGVKGEPDQSYRLFLSFFIHAGILHLLITLLFNFYVLRDLEKYLGWLSTSLLFIGSGLGGNLFSAIFVPYSPEVGPAAGQFGVITFFFVFIFYHWSLFANASIELFKYFALIVVPLFFVGLFPYVDNFARVGGLIFGLFLGFIVVHYIPDHQSVKEFRRYVHSVYHPDADYHPPIKSSFAIVKYILLLAGVIGVITVSLIAFVWFLYVQDTLDVFQYFNCILGLVPGGEVYCLDYGQNIRSRDIM